VDNGVQALALSGSDLYVGGVFVNANVGGTTVPANRLAKLNITTGVWSALGTSGGNGLNRHVFALVLKGSDLYVGGWFTMANVGGTPVSANLVAKVDTTTGVWNPLADTGGGNGIPSSEVLAMAFSGTDLFVGGTFSTAGDKKPSQNIARFCAN
jgi:hypothetical protein